MPEVRLIDANALLKRLQEQQKYGSTQDSRGRAKAILEVIHAPTIEAEPIRHGRWIPVSERLPEKTGYYLVCDSTIVADGMMGRQDVSKYVIGRHGGHWYGAIRRECITHWMPLPEPPEEVQE